jgi:excisionase family DNA binding protein
MSALSDDRNSVVGGLASYDASCILLIMDHMTIREAAALYSVTPITIRRHIEAGRLRAVRVGRNIRIRRTDADALAEPVLSEQSGIGRMVRRGKPLSTANGLRGLLELGNDLTPEARPTDVSSNKYAYLAPAYDELHA